MERRQAIRRLTELRKERQLTAIDVLETLSPLDPKRGLAVRYLSKAGILTGMEVRRTMGTDGGERGERPGGLPLPL